MVCGKCKTNIRCKSMHTASQPKTPFMLRFSRVDYILFHFTLLLLLLFYCYDYDYELRLFKIRVRFPYLE